MDPSPGTWASDEVCCLCRLACDNLGRTDSWEHGVEPSGILETRRAECGELSEKQLPGG